MSTLDTRREWVDLDGLSALLRFPFAAGPNRNRFLAGSGLLLIGMVIPLLPAIVVYGYLLRVMRGSIRGDLNELPAWDAWGEYIIDGLKALVVSFVYLLPGSLAMMAGFMAYFFAGPVSMIMLQAQRGHSSEAPAWLLLTFLGGMALMFIGISLGFLLSLLGMIPLPAAFARLAESGNLGDAFHLRAIWRLIRQRGWAYIAAWVVVMGLFGFAYLGYTLIYFTWILCAVAMFFIAPATFYVLTIGAVTFGRFYAQRNAAPSVVGAPEPSGDPAI